MTEDDILMKHLTERGNKQVSTNTENLAGPIKVSNINSFDDDKYINIPLSQLPCEKFYQQGTQLYIRAATVKEIQAYSIVDNTNRYDVTSKMNGILKNNIKLKLPNGNELNYKHLFELDKLTVIILISRLTRKDKKVLTKDVKCEKCNTDFKIEYTPQHFVYSKENEELKAFFSEEHKAYVLPFSNNEINDDIIIAPPKIGMQENIYDYILNKTMKKMEVNVSFMKIVPWLYEWNNDISIENMEKIEYEFENLLNEDKFFFLDDAISMVDIGLTGLKKTCSCGTEVHTPITFPGGASSIFVIPNAFREFIRK